MTRHRPTAPGRLSWTTTLLAGTLAVLLTAPTPATRTTLAGQGKAKQAGKKKPAAAKGPKFVRIVRVKKTGEPIRMETATVRYVLRKPGNQKSKPAPGKAGPLTVDLIAVVHVGERSYYDLLDRQFVQYDALLYELVAQQGARPPRGARAGSNNPAGALQNAMKSMLELDHQLENIDYTKKNFVHADLSPSEMAAAIRKRGENGLTITLGILLDMLRQQNIAQANARNNKSKKGGVAAAAQEIDLFTLLTDPNGPVKMKRMMAEQMVEMESNGGVGQTLDRILVKDRNKAAMRVFRQQLTKGKRRLGIFYGAAHMPDFHKRLTAMGFRPEKVTWSSAWDLRLRKQSQTSDLIQLMRLLQRLSR